MKDRVREWAKGLNNATPLYIGGLPTLEDVDRALRETRHLGEVGLKVYPTPQGEVPVIFRYGARRRA